MDEDSEGDQGKCTGCMNFEIGFHVLSVKVHAMIKMRVPQKCMRFNRQE